jgi:hypothetical protein
MTEKEFTLAPQDRLAAVETLAPRFFSEVLDLDYAECLTTDESDLCDYTSSLEPGAEEVEAVLDRIERHYLVDCRAAGSTRIVDLLEFLRDRGVIG